MGSIIAGGCSSSLKKIESDGALPQDLPSDFKQKFEIQEAVKPASAASDTEAKGQILGAAPVSPKGSPLVSSQIDKKSAKKKAKAHALPVTATQGATAPAAQVPTLASEAAPAPFQYPMRRPEKDPIWLSERQTYDITYFGMNAGEFTVEVLPWKVINNRKVYHIQGRAKSSSVFSLFYRLNDTIETFIDYEGIFSHRYHMDLDESKQTRDSLELYDSEKKQTFFWNRVNQKDKGFSEKKEVFPMEPFSQDSFSALYYLRTLPLPTGAVVTFPVISEGKNWEAVVTVVRRETVDAPWGKTQAIVLKPETKYQGILQKKGDSFIWLSDDDRRHLLRLEAKVKIGTVSAVLKKVEAGTPPDSRSPSAEGVKHP